MQTSMMVPAGGTAELAVLALSNGHKIRVMQHIKRDVEDTYVDDNDGALTSDLGRRKRRVRHWCWVVGTSRSAFRLATSSYHRGNRNGSKGERRRGFGFGGCNVVL